MEAISRQISGASLMVQWLRIRLPVHGSGKIPRAAGQLHLCVTVTEPEHLELVLQNNGEAPAMRSPCTAMGSSPRWPQLEEACT